MFAAKMAAMMGHTVELWEKSGSLGGDLKAAGAPSFKADMNRYYHNLETQVYKLGVNVRLKTEADRESVDRFAPDAVIDATGASPVIPRVPGIDGKNVVEAIRLMEGKESVGDKVVIIGGGLVGCEAAVDLDKKGKDVTLVEMSDEMREQRSWLRTSRVVPASHAITLYTRSDSELITAWLRRFTELSILYSP